ncbi:MAG: hypothetical protein M5U28_51455 [Sandaracinaceae bacterium]|nr:hypothetical protein [Sandaracinaceae bacterium]
MRAGRRGSVCLAIGLALGCGGPAAEAPPRVLIHAQADEAQAEEAQAPAPPREPPAASPTVTPCEHARRCCHAFIDAMMAQANVPQGSSPDIHSSCDALGDLGGAGTEACKSAMGSWRQALESMGTPVPAACGGR